MTKAAIVHAAVADTWAKVPAGQGRFGQTMAIVNVGPPLTL